MNTLEDASLLTKSGHHVKRPGLAVFGRLARDDAGKLTGMKPLSFGQTDAPDVVRCIEADQWTDVLDDGTEIGLEVELEGGVPKGRLFFGALGLRRIDPMYCYPIAPLPDVACVIVGFANGSDESEIQKFIDDFSKKPEVWRVQRCPGGTVDILYRADMLAEKKK